MVIPLRCTSDPLVLVLVLSWLVYLSTLANTGGLNVGYLGTKPPSAAIGGVKRDLDYDKLDEEHRKLLQVSVTTCTYNLFKES